jgi:rSAM/selenodomain-associated transferase 1
VILFVKNPSKTQVKSRLAAVLGSAAALFLYECFVQDLLETINQGGWPLIIAFYPSDAEEEMESWLGSGYTCRPQRGEDLGERMKNAFSDAFSQGFRSVLLIGSDIPDLSNRLLGEAFASLRTNDAVIGPSLDGGYYLIGFKHDASAPDVFEGVAWSTPEVFAQTMHIFRKAGYRVHELPSWGDIDTYDDLKALFSRSAGTPFADSATMRHLRKVKGGVL